MAELPQVAWSAMHTHVYARRGAARDPPWFSNECAMLRCHFREIVRSGQAVHACKVAPKLYRASVRRSKCAHSKHLKAVFFGQAALKKGRPAFHVLLPPAHAPIPAY